jgi:hypothetical protein
VRPEASLPRDQHPLSVTLPWSDVPITISHEDHPGHVPFTRRLPLVVDPHIGGTQLSRVLLDGGNDINIIFSDTLDILRIP